MPRGKYDNNIRKARYNYLRSLGVPCKQARLIRDWEQIRYHWFLINVRDYGLGRVLNHFLA